VGETFVSISLSDWEMQGLTGVGWVWGWVWGAVECVVHVLHNPAAYISIAVCGSHQLA